MILTWTQALSLCQGFSNLEVGYPTTNLEGSGAISRFLKIWWGILRRNPFQTLLPVFPKQSFGSTHDLSVPCPLFLILPAQANRRQWYIDQNVIVTTYIMGLFFRFIHWRRVSHKFIYHFRGDNTSNFENFIEPENHTQMQNLGDN